MSISLTLPTEISGSVETDVLVGGDRRLSPRMGCHTMVTAVTSQHPDESDGWRTMKVHSEDVSVTGAKLVSTHPLPGEQIYLRFLLPNFGKQFVKAEIVNQSIRQRVTMDGVVTDLFVYGVKFIGVVSAEHVNMPDIANAHDSASS